MFKSAASVSSLAYNFLLSFLLLFAYNGIFLQKLYAVTGSGFKTACAVLPSPAPAGTLSAST